MTVTVQVLVPPLQLAIASTSQYAAPAGTRAIVTKATVTNTDTVNRSFSVWLVTAGGTAGNDNLVIDDRAVVPGETYLCPELIGQVLAPGSFVVTAASAATALTFRMSGSEVS